MEINRVDYDYADSMVLVDIREEANNLEKRIERHEYDESEFQDIVDRLHVLRAQDDAITKYKIALGLLHRDGRILVE